MWTEREKKIIAAVVSRLRAAGWQDNGHSFSRDGVVIVLELLDRHIEVAVREDEMLTERDDMLLIRKYVEAYSHAKRYYT